MASLIMEGTITREGTCLLKFEEFPQKLAFNTPGYTYVIVVSKITTIYNQNNWNSRCYYL